MTEKQGKIVNAGLSLFAEEGYRSTATSKVAKRAGVSEGLIFRHFENKDGLLKAILELGEAHAKALFSEVVLETNPKEVIRKFIEIVLNTSRDAEASNFWKLQFKLKWELEMYEEHKMEDIESALVSAFATLRYLNPKQEANLLLTMMDGMATRFILQENFDLEGTVDFLKQRYKVSA